MTKKTVAERFFAKTKLADAIRLGMETPCLEWTGCHNGTGYGIIGHHGRNTLAHRVAWEIEHGEIPEKLFVLHRCDNPPCVRPDHLFLGNQFDNMRDAVAKGRMRRKGEENRQAKLKEADVRSIFRLRSDGLKHKAIASKVGISQTQVCDILAGRKWAHMGLRVG